MRLAREQIGERRAEQRPSTSVATRGGLRGEPERRAQLGVASRAARSPAAPPRSTSAAIGQREEQEQQHEPATTPAVATRCVARTGATLVSRARRARARRAPSRRRTRARASASTACAPQQRASLRRRAGSARNRAPAAGCGASRGTLDAVDDRRAGVGHRVRRGAATRTARARVLVGARRIAEVDLRRQRHDSAGGWRARATRSRRCSRALPPAAARRARRRWGGSARGGVRASRRAARPGMLIVTLGEPVDERACDSRRAPASDRCGRRGRRGAAARGTSSPR